MFLKKIAKKFLSTPLKLSISYKGSLSQKLSCYKYARMAEKEGVISFRIERVANNFTDGRYNSKLDKATIDLWASRGICPSRGLLCNITKNNISEFLSEFDFYNWHNYRGVQFANWYDDKLSTYYILNHFKEYIPCHYYYVSFTDEIQNFYKLDDVYPQKESNLVESVKQILKDKDIALKKCSGGHGAGFIKLSFKDNRYFINNEVASEDTLIEVINNLNGYLVTEFVKPNKDLRTICGEDSFAVLRVITLYSETTHSAEVAALIIRLGTSISGPTQATHDHMYAGVDMNDGTLFDPIYEVSDYEYYHTEIHPETKQTIVGYKLPNIDLLKRVVCEVAEYLPMTPYLVFDIIPTDSGFSILEINSHGQPFIVEPYYRIKENMTFRKIFKLTT